MKFSNEPKLRDQMRKRGWTDEMIIEAIYVALLDEGTKVWRPVDAERMPDGTYRIGHTLDPAGLGEKWEFQPGARVVCQPRQNDDGRFLAAVRLARAAG